MAPKSAGAQSPGFSGFDAEASGVASLAEALFRNDMSSEAPGSSSPASDSLSRFTCRASFCPEEEIDLSVDGGLFALGVVMVLPCR